MAKGVDLAFGRAIANGRDEGFMTRLFDGSSKARCHGEILCSSMVGTHAGDMIGETIRPHPTLGESIQEGRALVDRCAKHYSEPRRDKRCAMADELYLTPLELISGK